MLFFFFPAVVKTASSESRKHKPQMHRCAPACASLCQMVAHACFCCPVHLLLKDAAKQGQNKCTCTPAAHRGNTISDSYTKPSSKHSPEL